MHRSWKRSLVFLLPFAFIFLSTLTPYSWLGVPNGYVSNFDSQPFAQIGHVFSDPYSAYYDQENTFENRIESGNTLGRLETHYFKSWGYDVGFVNQIKAYALSAKFYLVESTKLVVLGGPFLLFFMLWGAYWLFKNDRKLSGLFLSWVVVWFAGLLYFETSNRSHFLEVLLIISCLSGIGIYRLIETLRTSQRKKLYFTTLLVLFVSAHLVYATRWKLRESYGSTNMDAIFYLSDEIRESKLEEGRIAVGIHPYVASGVHYLVDKDVVYFNPKTLQRLIDSGELKEAFEIYRVNAAVGFSQSISQNIKTITSAEIIPLNNQ